MKRLYVISGSSSSSAAQVLLSHTGISYETIDVSDRNSLAALYRDLEIGVLPAFLTEAGVFEGIEGIRTFVQDHRT